MMPPNSCAVPGRKPGTSSNVTSGMLKQSQNRTNLAPLSDALMSRHPARWAGWVAATPAGRPFSRRNPTTIFWGERGPTGADQRQALLLVLRGEVGDPRLLGVGRRPTQLLEGDLLVGDRLAHIRPGPEHVARGLRHK